MTVSDRSPLAAAMLLVLALTGCSVLDGATAPPPRTLQLVPADDVELAAGGDHGTLLVEPPSARAGYQTPAIAYRREALELSYFATAEWAAPPARLLADAVGDAFAGAGIFSAVVTPSAAVRADYRLQLELLYLEQDYRAGNGGVARLGVRARLVSAANAEVLGTRLFTAAQRASARGPAAAAEAASVATQRVLAELVRFVEASLPGAGDSDGAT